MAAPVMIATPRPANPNSTTSRDAADDMTAQFNNRGIVIHASLTTTTSSTGVLEPSGGLIVESERGSAHLFADSTITAARGVSDDGLRMLSAE